MKPKAWSFTALEAFENCPHQYYRVSVAKDFPFVETEATRWGNQVHTLFENRQKYGEVLPKTLEMHEPFMEQLDEMEGAKLVEEKISLNTKLKPCGYFDKDVWYRGVVDFGRLQPTHAYLVDYKTGKHHSKFRQLKMFALHTFIARPQIETVRVEFYWTQTRATNGQTYHRDQQQELWGDFMPTLRQFAEAFQTHTWQKRPSGLCNGWCPVKDCEHWKPRRV